MRGAVIVSNTGNSRYNGLVGFNCQRYFLVTPDIGTEFAGHAKLAAALQASFYFAVPYSSWQRGVNENTNV